ncbi:hypothetical protein Y032_0674g1408, partial [Ancylostoma ceylanicum]
MEGPRESLSERLSGLLAALRSSRSSQAESSGTTPSPAKEANNKETPQSPAPERIPAPNVQQRPSDLPIETLPDLLDFLRTASNPKVLREVVTRFLENPLLSENDRNLVKKKVQEKIEEVKKRKEAKRSMTSTDSPARSDASSRAQEISETSSPGLTPKPQDPSAIEQGQRIGEVPQPNSSINPVLPVPAPLNPVGLTPEDEANYNAQLIAKLIKEREQGSLEGSESTVQHNEWVSAVVALGQIPMGGIPVQNPVILPNAPFSAPPPSINPFAVPPPQIPQIHQIPGILSVPPPVAFQVPPPTPAVGAVAGVVPPNHGVAGFANRETLTTGAGVAVTIEYGKNALKPPTAVITKAEVVYERDIIPRTPTPPPPSANPLIRPGAMVPALSATCRLIMPGAPIIRRRRTPSPTALSSMEYENLYHEENRSDKKKEGRGKKRVAEVTNMRSAENTPVERKSLFETLSSENVGRNCYIRQYAIRHNVSFEEAERILVEEENEFIHERHEKKKRKTEAYTKGFAPLPIQKYAKNVDDYGRTADEAYEDPYDDYDRPADAAYEEPYEYDRAVDPAYEEPYDDAEREPWRRSSHRESREEYKESREYEDRDRGYEPVYYRERGGRHNYGERDYPSDDYDRYGSESSLDRRKRRKRGGKKHKAKLLERGYGPPERRSNAAIDDIVSIPITRKRRLSVSRWSSSKQ